MNKKLWDDNKIQFPRLLAEMVACVETSESDRRDLCQSMDLEWDEIEELFERAHNIHEIHKSEHCGAVELGIECPKCGHPHLCNPTFIPFGPDDSWLLDCDNCNSTSKIASNGRFVADPDNDEVECSLCHKIVDREDAFKDKKKDELVCATCLARVTAMNALDS